MVRAEPERGSSGIYMFRPEKLGEDGKLGSLRTEFENWGGREGREVLGGGISGQTQESQGEGEQRRTGLFS